MRQVVLSTAVVLLLLVVHGVLTLGEPVAPFSTPKMRRIAHLTDQEFIQSELREHFAVVRVAGTSQNGRVRDRILHHLSGLNAVAAENGLPNAWEISEDSFEDQTPFGVKTFTNVVATFNPHNASKRIVVAAHYDSKFFFPDEQGREFVGATDSAVPCVMILELARSLNKRLIKAATDRPTWRGPALQLIFFDGEEAFVQWNDHDSIYGARHLAEQWERQSQLANIQAFVLLDLIGAADMSFLDHFLETTHLYADLREIEDRLGAVAYRKQQFFPAQRVVSDRYKVEDDHIPFLRRGVPVLHLISIPFPSVWHTPDDNLSAISWDDTLLLQAILRVFLAQRLLI